MSTTLSPYGLLLTFDGYHASRSACGDIALIYKLLQDLPGMLNMRSLGFPHIVSVQEKGIKGLSGFTFIMESHISIHTYVERGFVTADIYSCKQFNTNEAADYLADIFKIRTFETSVLVRGSRFNEKTPSIRRPRPRMRS